MSFNSIRWGRSLSALVLVGAQVAACSSPAKKKTPAQFEEAGAGGEAGGDVAAAGKAPTAGSSGSAPVGGSGGNDDAGAPGTGAVGGDDQGGTGNSGGAAGTAASGGIAGGVGVAGSSTGGTSGSGGTGGTGGTLGTGGTGGTAGTGGSSGNAGAAGSACSAPVSTITTAATAVHGDTGSGNAGVPASVPSQTGVSYAWSVLNGGTINGSATQSNVAFNVGSTGTEVALQAVVTNTTTSCASTSVIHIPIPCQVPTLVSADGAPPVAHYIPSNEDTGRYDMTGSGNIWTAYLSAKSATASYNGTFNHFNGTSWAQPASASLFLNDTVNAHLLYYKVATDNAGDAVFTWTQTSDNNNYQVMVAAYRVSGNSWTTPKLVGTVFNQATPVEVRMDRASGSALIAWAAGPNASVIPHLRSYSPGTDTLGTDIALRATTTGTYNGDSMNLSLETNDSLTGFAAWFEHDGGTGLDSLYALHITAGVPDTVASAYDIKTLAAGTATFTTDVFNYNSAFGTVASAQPRMIAVSANGNAAVVWNVYNGLASGAIHGELYARRYTPVGGWAAAELVASQGPGFSRQDWGVDNAGNVLINVWTNNVGFDFFAGVSGSAWSTVQHLSSVNGSTALPHINVDSTTGKGIATYRDPGLSSRAPLRGVFYDPTSHALSPAFTIDDPQKSGGEGGRVVIDSTGLATVLYTQMPLFGNLPPGSNSSNSSLLYSTTCK